MTWKKYNRPCQRCRNYFDTFQYEKCPFCGYPEGEPPRLTDLSTPATGLVGTIQPMPRGGKRENSGRKAQTPGNPRSELFSVRVTKDELEQLKAKLQELRIPIKSNALSVIHGGKDQYASENGE